MTKNTPTKITTEIGTPIYYTKVNKKDRLSVGKLKEIFKPGGKGCETQIFV